MDCILCGAKCAARLWNGEGLPGWMREVVALYTKLDLSAISDELRVQLMRDNTLPFNGASIFGFQVHCACWSILLAVSPDLERQPAAV